MCGLPLKHSLLGNLAHNLVMCSDWESNQEPFGSQASTQSTEPYQPGFTVNILWYEIHCASSNNSLIVMRTRDISKNKIGNI